MMLIKNKNTGKIHKAIVKNKYTASLFKLDLNFGELRVYKSLCNRINEDSTNINFIEGKDNLINCYFCLKKMGLK